MAEKLFEQGSLETIPTIVLVCLVWDSIFLGKLGRRTRFLRVGVRKTAIEVVVDLKKQRRGSYTAIHTN